MTVSSAAIYTRAAAALVRVEIVPEAPNFPLVRTCARLSIASCVMTEECVLFSLVGRKMRTRKSREIKSLPRYLDRFKRFRRGSISTIRYPSSDLRVKATANLSCSREDEM